VFTKFYANLAKRKRLNQKNPVLNFISVNGEMLAFLSNLGQKWRVGGGIEEFMDKNLPLLA